MPGIVIKDFPPELHRKLKEQAARHHRSMTKEVVALLEQAIGQAQRSEEFPPPFKGRFPVTDAFIDTLRTRRRYKALLTEQRLAVKLRERCFVLTA